MAKFKSGSLNTRICRFLYNYRKSVHSSTGKSPAEILFGRCFKTTLQSVKCYTKKNDVEELAKKLLSPGMYVYKVGDAVFAKKFGKGDLWIEGQIVEVLGVRNYLVQVHNFGDMLWKRHHDQLMPRFIGNICSTPQNCNLPSTFLPMSSNVNNNAKVSEYSLDVNVSPSLDLDINESPGYCLETDKQVASSELSGDRDVPSVSPMPTLRRPSQIVKPPDRLNV